MEKDFRKISDQLFGLKIIVNYLLFKQIFEKKLTINHFGFV